MYDHPPDRQTGEFLGPLNWFSVSESVVFLEGNPQSHDVGIRPERLRICIAAESQFELVAMPFVGAYCESGIRHVVSGITKSVLHQVPDVMPSIGDRVVLRQLGATV